MDNYILAYFQKIKDGSVTVGKWVEMLYSRMVEGIESGEDKFAPAKLEISKENPHVAWVEIREGKFHQVKRMFKACGKTVVKLRRLSIGALRLEDSLPFGAVRVLDREEANMVFLRQENP